VQFIKMHGIGNDYVFVNGYEQTIDDPAAMAPRITDRHYGVGGDGLILVLPPEEGTDAHVRMRMFNADGSEAEMCGNGVRCVCKLAHDHGLCDANPMRIQTGSGVLTLSYTTDANHKVDMVTVNMGEPILESKKIPVEFPQIFGKQHIVDFPLDKYIPLQPAAWMQDCGLDMHMTCVSVGNPHLVIYCGCVGAVPLEAVGPFLERQDIFPNRTNVHFVQVHSPTEITMRTWERGSGRTLACGTGASAVCVAGVLTGRSGREILAHLPGGDLTLEWRQSDNHVYMTGPATETFTGQWDAGS